MDSGAAKFQLCSFLILILKIQDCESLLQMTINQTLSYMKTVLCANDVFSTLSYYDAHMGISVSQTFI